MSNMQDLVHNFNVAIQAPKDEELRIKLIQEEVDELIDAAQEKDVIGIIDALCDILYVTYGAADVYGVVLDVDEWPMDPIADPDWDKIRSKEALDYFRGLASVEALNFKKDIKTPLEELASGCWAFGAGAVGVDLHPFFLEVHRTNMHKLSGPRREDGKQLKPPGWKPPRIGEMYDKYQAGLALICAGTCPIIWPEVRIGADHPAGGYVCKLCGGLIVDPTI